MIYIDEHPRNADWIQVLRRGRELAAWTGEAIDAACASPYNAYVDEVRARHIAYFAAHPELRSSSQSFIAVNRAAAFPPGASHLGSVLPEREWHRHHLSGGSSQVLAIALLTAARDADRSLAWLPFAESLGASPMTLFEVTVAPELLNEHPRQTTLDYLVLGDQRVVAAEAKFTERGFGTCSCPRRAEGVCSPAVQRRQQYWRVAKELFLPEPAAGSCSLSVAYQAIRNVAAAAAIAGRAREASFVLFYDDRNPYFAGSGEWPGWAAVLDELCRYASVSFVALTWQELLRRVVVDRHVLKWARDKHGLIGADPA